MTILDEINEKLKRAPPQVAQEVLDFIGYLESKNRLARSSSRTLADYAGVLKGSPSFEGDPVELQRRMRSEWDHDER